MEGLLNNRFFKGWKMKILFVGDGSYDMYSKAFFKAACDMDDVEADLLEYGNMNIKSIPNSNYFKRAEYHFCVGPDVNKINYELLKRYELKKYDIIFLYSAELIYPRTVKKLKKQGAYIAIYHNDNPFSEGAKKYRYRHFIKSIKFSDIAYAYRKSNISDYLKYGAKNAKLLMSYYIANKNYYVNDDDIKINVPDVCFVGHYEDDGRLDYIYKLLEKGIQVGVPEVWKGVCGARENLVFLADTLNKYNEILNKTKIAIVFLSSLNKDTYTRRCFEIPAVKTMMVAPYTEDIAAMFKNGEEAVLFNNAEEFVEKINYFIKHEDERKVIAENGYIRLKKDGHEVTDRLKSIIMDWTLKESMDI